MVAFAQPLSRSNSPGIASSRARPRPRLGKYPYPRSALTTSGYRYDPIGNRLTSTNNAEVLSYAANSLNQYTNIQDGVTNTPTYDLDGNMVTSGDWTFSWDGENRLIAASNGTSVVSFAYDCMGRRYQKVVGTVTNTFLYDRWAMIREQSSSGVTNSYVYGLDLSGSMQGYFPAHQMMEELRVLCKLGDGR